MTGAGFGDVDFDRLADYVGGALDGTPEAATVADLVATDTRWADAYAALCAADAAVRADLAELAGVPEPIPADVAARLNAALDTATVGTGALGTASHDAPPDPDAGRHRHRAPPAGRPGRGPAATRRRRNARLATILATAVAVVVCAVGGVAVVNGVLRPGSGGVSSLGRDSTAAQPGGQAAAPYAPSGAPAPRLLASGTDYQPGTVGGLTGRTAPPSLRGAEPTRGADNSAPDVGTRSAPGDLRRLSEPSALDACLAAVVREYGGTVTVVDYARFQGTPALVILVTGAFGDPNRQWAVVVGAACGTGGAITVELYNGPAS